MSANNKNKTIVKSFKETEKKNLNSTFDDFESFESEDFSFDSEFSDLKFLSDDKVIDNNNNNSNSNNSNNNSNINNNNILNNNSNNNNNKLYNINSNSNNNILNSNSNNINNNKLDNNININNNILNNNINSNILNSNIKNKILNDITNKKQKIDKNLDQKVFSGFTTGKNKPIEIKKENLSLNKNIFNDIHKNLPVDALIPLKQPNVPIRKYNCPVKGHFTEEIRKTLRIKELFQKIKKSFCKLQNEEIFFHFKWSYLHFYLNPPENHLQEEITNLIKIRIQRERSILKNILEFDDIPYRFMVLGVLDIKKEFISVFDGFYSINIKIDGMTYEKLKGCRLGDKIYVFGCELLISKPISILEVKDKLLLKMNYNGVEVCHSKTRFGYKKRISFLSKIKNISMAGGIVSCLIIKVVKIIEDKYFITVENYRNKTENIEEEIEKIQYLALKANKKLNNEDYLIKKYYKLLVEDETGQCLLTWWNPPEIKINEKFKFVYLVPVKKALGIHLSTSRKTYHQKL